MLNLVAKAVLEKGMGLRATPEAMALLAKEGYDPAFGARPLRRTIQNRIEDPLSDAVLRGEFDAGDTVVVDVEKEEIVLRKEQGELPSPADEGEAERPEEPEEATAGSEANAS